MAESVTIPKKKKDGSDEFSFARLYQQGLEYIQQLSGERWTDYNLHDPGVTILEQLCFALTDLLYRTDYSVPDLLTGPDGRLDYAALSLHPPEKIFPSRPVTSDDYRRILFSTIEEIDNVWMESPAGAGGLHRILIAPGPGRSTKELKSAVAETYAQHRNLCEDVGEIVLLRPVSYQLKASVRIDGSVTPEEMLAEIYHKCGRETAGRPEVIPYADLAQKERPEDLFNGPLTGGKISGLRQAVGCPPSAARILSVLQETDGIEQVESFSFFADPKENISSTDKLVCYQLTVPENREQAGVRLTKNGRETIWSWTRFRARLKELEFKERTLRRRQPTAAAHLYPLPTGTCRNPGQYASIQNLFPDIYGVNARGVPKHCPAEEQAAAAQLKAYLLLFEHILADYLAQLENIPSLFSIEGNLRQSYFRQSLDSSNVPGIDKVLMPDAESFFEELRQQFDTYRDRKSRVLDYLLALYGERFTGKSLRNLNTHMRPDEFQDHLLDCKAKLLKHVVEVNRHRSAAVNYQEAVWGNPENISGMQRKAALLLGWKEDCHNRSLTEVFSKAGLSIADDCCSDDAAGSAEDNLEPVPPVRLPDESIADLRQKARPLLPKDGSIPASLLRHGLRLKAYGLAARERDKTVRVRFRPAESAARWLPGLFADKEQAVLAVNALHRLLERLNQDSEAMHVVEHILLRPAEASEAEMENFYSSRISVALPNWTAHCGQEHFRRLVEETVRLCCPAQVMPTFCWLTFAQMCEFERLYPAWLDKKRTLQSGDSALEQAAAKLADFLRAQQPKEEELW